jgi:hypothetical protein
VSDGSDCSLVHLTKRGSRSAVQSAGLSTCWRPTLPSVGDGSGGHGRRLKVGTKGEVVTGRSNITVADVSVTPPKAGSVARSVRVIRARTAFVTPSDR